MAKVKELSELGNTKARLLGEAKARLLELVDKAVANIEGADYEGNGETWLHAIDYLLLAAREITMQHVSRTQRP